MLLHRRGRLPRSCVLTSRAVSRRMIGGHYDLTFPCTLRHGMVQALLHLGVTSDYHARILETGAVAKHFTKLPEPQEETKDKQKVLRSLSTPLGVASDAVVSIALAQATPSAPVLVPIDGDEAIVAVTHADACGDGGGDGGSGGDGGGEAAAAVVVSEVAPPLNVTAEIEDFGKAIQAVSFEADQGEADASGGGLPQRQLLRAKPELVTLASEAPSTLLTGIANELRAAGDSHKVHLLEHGLQMLKHQVDQIWVAARRLVEVAQAENVKDQVPNLVRDWVRLSPVAEVQSVQSMFKTLQLEAEAKKKEELIREEELHSPGANEKSHRRRKQDNANPSPALAMSSRVPW